jgi:hypothetical protein
MTLLPPLTNMAQERRAPPARNAVGTVSKEEMSDLYTLRMAKRARPVRMCGYFSHLW